MEVSGQYHAPVTLPTGHTSPLPNRKVAGWAANRVQALWRRVQSLPLPGTQTPDRPACNPLTTPTALSWIQIICM